MAKKRSYALVKVISCSKIIESFPLRLSFNAALKADLHGTTL